MSNKQKWLNYQFLFINFMHKKLNKESQSLFLSQVIHHQAKEHKDIFEKKFGLKNKLQN